MVIVPIKLFFAIFFSLETEAIQLGLSSLLKRLVMSSRPISYFR
jgi:hypothetical protein